MIAKEYSDVETFEADKIDIYELEYVLGETGEIHNHQFVNEETAKRRARDVMKPDNGGRIIFLKEKRFLLFSVKDIDFNE